MVQIWLAEVSVISTSFLDKNFAGSDQESTIKEMRKLKKCKYNVYYCINVCRTKMNFINQSNYNVLLLSMAFILKKSKKIHQYIIKVTINTCASDILAKLSESCYTFIMPVCFTT